MSRFDKLSQAYQAYRQQGREFQGALDSFSRRLVARFIDHLECSEEKVRCYRISEGFERDGMYMVPERAIESSEDGKFLQIGVAVNASAEKIVGVPWLAFQFYFGPNGLPGSGKGFTVKCGDGDEFSVGEEGPFSDFFDSVVEVVCNRLASYHEHLVEGERPHEIGFVSTGDETPE